MSAHRAIVRHRYVPGHEIAPVVLVLAGQLFAAVIGVLLSCLLAVAGALHQAALALGTPSRHSYHQWLGEGALGISRTGQKPAKPAAFDDHFPSALIADLVGFLVGHLQPHALQILFRLLQLRPEGCVKSSQQLLPLLVPRLHVVQLLFHAGSEAGVHNVGKFILHQAVDHLAQRRGVEVLAVLDDVLPVQNGADGRRVGRRPADAVFLQRPDKGRVGIPGRRLGEVLPRLESQALQPLPFRKRRELALLFLLLLVLALLVHRCVAGEFQTAAAGPEAVNPRLNLHRHRVIDGVGHLTGHKPAPDQPVQPVLVVGQITLHPLRSQLHIAGPDGLVGVLGPRLGLIGPGGLGAVPLAVPALNEAPGCGQGLVAQAQGVGTHIGDQAHGALAGDIHALIELLGDGHSPPGGHAQFPAGLLLEGGSGEGSGGRALLLLPLHGFHGKGGGFHRLHHRVDLLDGIELLLFAVLPVVVGQKSVPLRAVGGQPRVQGPVLLGLEGRDLMLPVADHPGRHGLDPSGGQAAADFFPQQGRELIAHNPVQNPPGLLGVHQTLVDLPGPGNRLTDHPLGDLIEGHAAGLLILQVQQLFQMPADSFPFPVRVGGQIDHVAGLGGFFQVADNVLFPLDGAVFRFKVVVNIHAQSAFGQVPQVAHTGFHLIAGTQILADGLCLGGRLHDHETRFCHSFLLDHAHPWVCRCNIAPMGESL